ncbi:TetR/AcrR family transcriptional regulator [Paraliobacillus salinarum]|uniref:TetR/AcrR family transcriptional regulator n=1 Tax=Paraliobacillus salinarum TaxID=1158996 RepID=UPI0015F74989|nr:TetR/AcrR family transcriptional regulator [Paraliobacillus salinarum]
MTEKLDRRKKYTRMILKQSLMEILREKPIRSITIKEICERADINRSTFYTHYASQYDLLHQIEEEIITDMNETLASYNYSKEDEGLQMTIKILEYVVENRAACETLLSEHGDVSFKKRVMKHALEHTVYNLVRENQVDQELTEYISLFYVSGSIQVIETWLKNGMDKTPEEMAKMISNLANKGISGL